jgi:ribonuclease BN (tRNA processing enzyme)
MRNDPRGRVVTHPCLENWKGAAAVELTILGCGGGVPLPGGALCGHLLTHGDTKIWVDAGNGTLGQLLRHARADEIDAVVISHRHWDHFLDLYPFALARWGLDDESPATPPFRLIAPPDFLAHAEQLVGGAGAFDGIVEWEPLEPGKSVRFGEVTLDTLPMRHGVPTLGMRFSAAGKVISYSADTAPCDELTEIARDADAFVCEAWFGGDDASSQVHLTARQAGEHAERAGAKSLVLTHVYFEKDLDAACAAARTAYAGPVTAAATDDVLRV